MDEKRLKIGLDFDDTLMHTREGLVGLLNAAHGTAVRLEECTEYFFSSRWNLSEEQFTEFFNQHETHLHEQPPLEGMLMTLRVWSAFADFFVITGRPECWLASAAAWLEKHDIRMKGMMSSRVEGSKGGLARVQKLDFFVEDHFGVAEEIAAEGIPVFLIDRPYNQGAEHPLIHRVKDWREIGELVLKRWPLESGTQKNG